MSAIQTIRHPWGPPAPASSSFSSSCASAEALLRVVRKFRAEAEITNPLTKRQTLVDWRTISNLARYSQRMRGSVLARLLLLLLRRRVPDLDGVVRTGGGQAVAVGAERHGEHRFLRFAQRERLLVPGEVPQFHRAILAAGRQPPAVGREGHATHRFAVCLGDQDFLETAPLPHAHRAVVVGRRQAL